MKCSLSPLYFSIPIIPVQVNHGLFCPKNFWTDDKDFYSASESTVWFTSINICFDLILRVPVNNYQIQVQYLETTLYLSSACHGKTRERAVKLLVSQLSN